MATLITQETLDRWDAKSAHMNAVAQSLTKNKNVQAAIVNALLWHSWYPNCTPESAAEFASRSLGTDDDYAEMLRCIKDGLARLQ